MHATSRLRGIQLMQSGIQVLGKHLWLAAWLHWQAIYAATIQRLIRCKFVQVLQVCPCNKLVVLFMQGLRSRRVPQCGVGYVKKHHLL